MRGLWTLKERLGSSIEIRELDIDAQFSIPRQSYGLTLFLGALYHLRNPFHAMDVLARASEYCALSTRIARQLPDGTRIREGIPLAYLLDPYELNDDDSNYWIFFEAALKRLLRRTNWEICNYFTIGDTSDSDPVSLAHDERAFCLLRSHYGLNHLNLATGWHAPEESGWRWTERMFALSLSPDRRYQRLTMRVFVPDLIFERLGPVTMSATADGNELNPVTFDKPGSHVVDRRLNLEASREHVLQFRLDKCWKDDSDKRELGIIIASVEFD
jgi:hypothetical protein